MGGNEVGARYEFRPGPGHPVPEAPAASGGAPFIAITGFMGTGKTETGRALAAMLGLAFTDTDELIEEREGTTIPDIFARHGEAHFRAVEEEICARVAARSGVVVATGGGTLLSDTNFEVLSARGPIVLLEASPEAIAGRVADADHRPLLSSALPTDSTQDTRRRALLERIAQLLDRRRPVYEKLRLRIDTTFLTPPQAAARIAATLDLPAHRFAIRVPEGSLRTPGLRDAKPESHVEIGCGLLSNLGARLHARGLNANVLLLIAEPLCGLYLDQLTASLDHASIPWTAVPVRDGDAAKTLEQTGEIIAQFASAGATRDSVAVTVGGGVTGDLGGFAASIYMRGIALVQVPTTLLAQVDASIGGKVGANIPAAKNLVGSFHQPALVLSDPCTLRTLPDAEITNGMAEVVKTAILGSPGLFDFLERELREDPEQKLHEPGFLYRCVTECAAIKAAVVERDPFEGGERRVLNLGHTLGHALEAVAGYTGFTHGQAVSIGTVAACRIAATRGLIDPDLLSRVRQVLERCRLPVTAPPCDEQNLLRSLHLDKKKKSGRLRYVLPAGIGTMAVVDDVSDAEILSAMHATERS